MALKEIALPNGGRAWVRTRLSHERNAGVVAVMAGMSVMVGRAKKLAAQADTGEFDADTTTNIQAISHQVSDAKRDIIGLGCQRWDDVRDPDNPDKILTFPDEIEKLDEEDFDFLFQGVLDAIAEGKRATDPKAGAAALSGTSSPSRTGSSARRRRPNAKSSSTSR